MKKPRFKEKTKTIVLKVLSEYEVIVIVSNDLMRSRTTRDKLLGFVWPPEKAFRAMHDWERSGTSRSYLFFDPEASPGTVAHECWHAVHHIFDVISAALDNEMVAYHLGYLVNEVSEVLHGKF